MWVVHHLLALAALYAVIITGIYFAQTWLLFSTALTGEARVRLPASTQCLRDPAPPRTKGSLECESRLRERRRTAGRCFCTLAGTPGTAKRWPSPSTRSFHAAMPSFSTTAAMAEQPQAERGGALLGLARNIRSPGAKECRRAHPSGRLQPRRCGRRLSNQASCLYQT